MLVPSVFSGQGGHAMDEQEFSAVVAAPFGRLGLRCNEHAVYSVDFLPQAYPLRSPGTRLARQAAAQLQRYLDDPAQPFTLPLARLGTPFQLRVWDALRDIPPGQTRSYGELARALGSAPRAVGGACRSNPLPLLVPCHRVCAAHGIGGFSGARAGEALTIKQWLLAHEGAPQGVATPPGQRSMEFEGL
jgi:methylated-DNA-[protein]-cysteine S-methyltransferase